MSPQELRVVVDKATLGWSHVLVALEEEVVRIGAPVRHNLTPPQQYEQNSFMCWILSHHRNIVNVLLYSDPALKGSLCLPDHLFRAWIIKVP